MNKDWSKTKIDIKDWFIVQRIRTLNFIKEHKYISVAIFTFLFVALIGFIVYAQDGSDTVVSIAEANRVVLDGEDVEKAESFSEVVYELKYKIDLAGQQEGEEPTQENKTVIIEASFSEQEDNNGNKIDAEWILYEEENVNFFTNDENGSLTAEIYDVLTGTEKTLKLHLHLKNIAPETSFAPTFKIYDKKYEKSENINEEDHSKIFHPEAIVIESTELELYSKVFGGEAYKSDDFNGRYAPFGIALGFNKYEYESMKGLYFNPEQKITLSAYQIYSNSDEETYFELDKIEKYGVYNKDIKGLNIEELSNVFNSGKTVKITKIEDDTSYDESEPKEDEFLPEIEQSYLYQLEISDIKSDGKLYINTIDEEEFITLGTYYVVLNSEREEDNEDDIEVILTSYNDNYEEESSATLENVFYQEGTQTYELTLNKQTRTELTPILNDEYLTYGDEVILSSIYNYDSSWDDNLEELYIRLDLQTDNEIPVELLSYSQESLFYASAGYEDKIKIVAYKTSEMEELLEDELVSLEEIDDIEYLIFKIEDIVPGSKVEVRLKGKISSAYDLKTATLISGVIDEEYEYLEELSSDLEFNITPFRSSTTVYVGKSNGDIIINESTTSTTFSIFPSVELPALKIESSLLESPYVDVLIHVILPDEMKYVENMQYESPQISGNTLTYVIEKQLINGRIEPVYIDVNFDPAITKNNTKMDVKVIIETVLSNNEEIYDTTPEEKRTTIRTITYNSVEAVVGSLTFNKNSVSKEEMFNVISTVSNKSQNNISLGLVTLLPYNENMSNNEVSYSGTYSFDIPKDSVCTNALPSNIRSSEKLLLVEWKDCSEFNVDEITALKTNIELSSEETYVQNMGIRPIDNEADDKYNVYSYMIFNESEVKKMGEKTISVFSKKLTGVVWEDFDSDGIMDSDEDYVPDIILKLYDSSDEMIDETISNNKGEYTFTDIQEGNYYIIAEFNKDKYSTTIKLSEGDLSKTSSFEQVADEIIGKAIASGIEINEKVKIKPNVNLGLSLRQIYKVGMKKYITKIVTTNNLGISDTKEYGKTTSFVKLDVKDINNVKIKVVYLIEIENTGYYPGYVREIRDYIPNGMSFNENYEENENWIKAEGNENYLINRSLSDRLIDAGEKIYIPIAFDISRKEAGSFKNYVEISDDDLEIFKINKNDIIKGGK